MSSKKWYSKLIVGVLLISLVFSLGACGLEETFVWNDVVLGDKLPTPPSDKGDLHTNTAEELWVEISDLSDKQFSDYIESCKANGFTVDIESNSSSFDAYNGEGYKLSLSHYGNSGDMTIRLEAPMEMSTISWPAGAAGQKLPVPKSTIGKISYEYDDNFFAYIGNTTKEDFAEYVTACSDAGFNVDYSKGDTHYYAYDSEGWSLSLRYVGNNTMSIDIDAPSDTEETAESTVSATTEAETEPEKDDTDDLDPDFIAAMDSYEEFMNEYVAFMKKYQDDPSNLSLLSEYADYMSKYTDFIEDFEKWEDEDMNAAELAYYVDVQARVTKKLLEVA